MLHYLHQLASLEIQMDAIVHKLLLSCDNEGFEVPHNDRTAFPFRELSESVTRIRERIRVELDIDLKRQGHIEDASFLDDLYASRPEEGKTNQTYYAFCIRFSNFGRLFTIYGLNSKVFAEFPFERVRQLVEGEGWTYVPEDQLHELYDGMNKVLRKQGVSWWIRYFDYF
jgi:hypothetical protein